MKSCHILRDIRISGGKLSLEIDGKSHVFNLVDISKVLATASDEEVANFKVSPAGYGIHWPLIDEDIAIDGLLGIQHSPGSRRISA